MNHQQLKLKRREILAEIDRLESKRCENCTPGTHTRDNKPHSYYACGCKAAEKIRKLGNRLIKLTSKRSDPFEVYFDSLPKKLTTLLYKKLKKVEIEGKKITDYKIAKHYGIDLKELNMWKRKEGIK